MTSRAALGAGAIACALLGAMPARAQTSCNAANRFTLNWDAIAPKANLGTGNRTYVVTNGAGQSVTVTMSFAGVTNRYIDSGFGQTPNISIQNTGTIGNQNTLFLATDFLDYTTNIASNTHVAVVRFGFSVPVREVTFTLLDVDFANNQFRDWVSVGGTSTAGSYVPSIVTPYGRNNSTNPGITAPGVTYVGPGTISGYSFLSGQVHGRGTSDFDESFGNVTAQFPTPITQAEIRYGNGPDPTMGGTAGIQSISVHDLTFCPMPQLTVVKSSTPYVTAGADPNRFNIPGADVIYAITVTNTGGSPAEIGGALLTDILPASMTYYGGDFDGVGPVVGPFDVSYAGGTTVTGGAVTFSNNGGSTYAYTPGAGYDAAVDAIRMSGTGTIPPGGTVTVRFRARIN